MISDAAARQEGMRKPEWVGSSSELRALVETLRGEPRYGVDTEFHRERSYWPHLALVQLAWSDGIALVDPLAADPTLLRPLLESSSLAVVHAAAQDLEVLERACGAVPSRIFDTQLAAGFLGLSSPSLSTLVGNLLGVRLDKGDRLSDWTVRPLGAEQTKYAASDVEHLLALHDVISAQLSDLGRQEWAEQECEVLRTRPRGPAVPEEAWWRMKDARQLKGRSRGIAQELAAWRERQASRLDRPARFVLSDLALSAIANRPPRTVSELSTVRGLDGRGPGAAVGEAILAAVRVGAALPPEKLRLPPSESVDRSLRPAVTLAGAWVSQLAAELSIETSLLGTRADIQALVGGEAGARMATGWRAELLGRSLADVVAGRVALVLDGRGGLIVEQRSHVPVVAARLDQTGGTAA
ncbi:MAG: HRDC domain-containing protein [Actinomycetota bacterium]|nr:HRDC domain-containing protein [Actinomycetota bacterium]